MNENYNICEKYNRRYFCKVSVAASLNIILIGLNFMDCQHHPESAAIPYKGTLLPIQPTQAQLLEVVSDYKAIILNSLQFMVDRYNRNPDYQWIDTKISLITGKDFPTDDPLRGPDTVYGWIQGRALEALVGHARWLRNQNKELSGNLVGQIDKIIKEVFSHLSAVWEQNSKHLFFFMTPQGDPFLLDSKGNRQLLKLTCTSPYNYSDVFAAKGMYTAAQYLQDQEAIIQAKEYCLKVVNAVWEGNFSTDQQALDPKNPVTPVLGRHSHAPYMISIGIAAMLTEYEKDSVSVDLGLKLIQHILQHHVNLNNRWPGLKEYDFVEFIDDRGDPYQDSGRIFSDPGHSLEFIGLTLKFTSICKKLQIADRKQLSEVKKIETVMPAILEQNFINGFQDGPGGICKLFNLVTRTPINSDMPWWSLPETMRTALECWQIAGTVDQRDFCINALSKCHNAFFKHYLRPDLHFMAYQTRAKDGSIVDTIPATPDADPGYHTGLSLLDCISIIEKT